MTEQEWFVALCARFGWTPTPWRLDVMRFWALQEGMPFDETFNPWATTQPGDLNLAWDRGFGPGNWNSVPVRVYRTPEAGVEATYETLINGYYPNILRCFVDQVGHQEAVGPHDFTSWVGSASYGQRVVDYMNATTASKGMEDEPMTADERAEMNRLRDAVFANQARMDQLVDGGYSSVETRLSNLESNDGPFATRLTALEARTENCGKP